MSLDRRPEDGAAADDRAQAHRELAAGGEIGQAGGAGAGVGGPALHALVRRLDEQLAGAPDRVVGGRAGHQDAACRPGRRPASRRGCGR